MLTHWPLLPSAQSRMWSTAAEAAEAESLRLQKQEITPDLIKLREIEVQRQAIEKWDGHLPNVNGGAMPFLNLGGSGGR